MRKAQTRRILVVDDSTVVRSLLRSAIASDPGLELAGMAADGASALSMIDSVRPDLVLLDVEMPVLDGLATLRRLRAAGHRLPVIMCSSLTRRGAQVTVDALSSGATDYVAKPETCNGASSQSFVQDLLGKIRALTLSVFAHSIVPAIPASAASRRSTTSPASIIVIGVSTGGPAALQAILPHLPADYPLPILVVQHMPELFTRMLAERLSRSCLLPVVEASEGDLVLPGRVAIARGNWHLEIISSSRAGSAPTLHLSQSSQENHCRPSVDVLFRSAAAAFGSGVQAVLLTGMGSDGLAGARIVRSLGGSILAQDQATSAVWGMPGAVVHAGLTDRVLPLHAIGQEILRVASKSIADRREQVAS
ncbi:MAG TPA: chemotaxis response regulator protein-glutamate methylesterase [Terracidiphilus sp.]|jgi:two-component system chemotaxis response regulator CheB|nr:chemotaxis response regulator protein-glutamate methylesterase [Terracidiphilus sp.]